MRRESLSPGRTAVKRQERVKDLARRSKVTNWRHASSDKSLRIMVRPPRFERVRTGCFINRLEGSGDVVGLHRLENALPPLTGLAQDRPNFDPLRNNPRFQKLVGGAK
jgi:hypothetical protein